LAQASNTVTEYEARQQAIALAEQANLNLQERERALRESLAKRDFYRSNLQKKRAAGQSKQSIRLAKIELDKAENEAHLPH